MTPTNADLRQFILELFSDEELETLCFDYFREVYQNFSGGMTKNRKALLLIGYGDTRRRLEDLYAALARERPAAWRERFGISPVETFRRNVSTPPTTRDPRQVFISHATADAAFAHRLADDLRAEGWPVWIAPQSIGAGEKWVEAIDRGLETSGVFVVALTPQAVTSRWVRTETNAAIALEHRGQVRFFPLDVAECELPVLWGGYQHVAFRHSYEAGLAELLAWLEQSPAPTPPQTQEALPPAPPLPLPPASPPRPPAQEKRVKEEQWRQLQALAHEIAAALGRQSGNDETREVFRRFNRAFGLTTYKKLPRRRFAEGLAFLKDWRDEMIAAAPVETFRRNVSTMPGDRRVHEKTGIELIRIPAGPFLYGSAESDKQARANETPQRTVDLPEYWIGRTPVTNAQYKRFLEANPAQPAPGGWYRREPLAGKSDHPVVNVSWHDAKAFCDWAGLALPTEEQWEKAARGTDGRVWPWGNEPPTADHCNFDLKVGNTTRVSRYSPKGDSPYGCVDMAGNVLEWTVSWYMVGRTRALRGGAWTLDDQFARAACRYDLDLVNSYSSVGFRVVELLSDPDS